ncbi:tRNA(Glu) pseudouridine(13) synthase [Gammaproteobacteria bacterium]|nr:tRNA(Glu) pseudouridine(13) synthase [Gammaproteobacteria bacterium]
MALSLSTPSLIKPLQYLYQAPKSNGILKTYPEDFCVKEHLGFDLNNSGDPHHGGEHVFVYIQKRNANTMFVAEALSKHLKIHPKLISHAGLKDRNALTEQWFGIHLPGKETPDLLSLEHPEFKVLKQVRHNKKLKTGALAGNFFKLIVRDINDKIDVESRLAQIKLTGVPNYFGEQRFGHEDGNLSKAIAWSKGLGRIPDRSRRSFFLSAARSFFFNSIVSARLENGSYATPLIGDQVQFTDGNSYFTVKAEDLTDVTTRFKLGLLRITAPLIGKAPWKSAQQEILSLDTDNINNIENLNEFGLDKIDLFEKNIVSTYPELFKLLVKETATHRRAISLMPQDLSWNWLDDATLEVSFYLPSGCYATTIMREVVTEQV